MFQNRWVHGWQELALYERVKRSAHFLPNRPSKTVEKFVPHKTWSNYTPDNLPLLHDFKTKRKKGKKNQNPHANLRKTMLVDKLGFDPN